MIVGNVYQIRINLQERNLYLYQGNNLFGTHRVAIGKPSTPSPIGSWTIANKAILAGGTVYGTRWMGLSIDNYGIHGNNNPSSIGKAVSLGCIRMYNEEVERLFSLLPIGTLVNIEAGMAGSGYSLPPYNPQQSGNNGSAQNKIYVIKTGDTLWSIAQKHSLKLEDLVKANPQVNPNLIFPGHILNIP